MLHMRPLFLLPLVVFTASCAADSATEPSALSIVSAHKLTASAVARPAGGTCAVTGVAVPPFPFAPPLYAPIVNLQIAGVCQLKHLGRTTFVGVEVINLATGTVTNTGTWTAANGDQLMSQFNGTGVTDGIDATFSGIITFISGTGRFQGVSGSLDMEGNSNASTNPATGEYRMTGNITY